LHFATPSAWAVRVEKDEALGRYPGLPRSFWLATTIVIVLADFIAPSAAVNTLSEPVYRGNKRWLPITALYIQRHIVALFNNCESTPEHILN
jgi:hypothetical protein